MLLFAGELHSHGPSDGARQEHRVGRDVVGAVPSVTTRRLEADDADPPFGPPEQQRQVGPEQQRALRAGPDGGGLGPDVRHRAGRSDRAVHLVGPDVGSRHPLGGPGEGRLDVAAVEQHARTRRVGPDGALRGIEVGQGGRRGPDHREAGGGPRRVFFTFADDADEIADHHHGDADRRRDRRPAPLGGERGQAFAFR